MSDDESSIIGNPKFFEWVVECCRHLGKPATYGETLLQDPCWFFAFDDGLTAKQAVSKYKDALNNNKE